MFQWHRLLYLVVHLLSLLFFLSVIFSQLPPSTPSEGKDRESGSQRLLAKARENKPKRPKRKKIKSSNHPFAGANLLLVSGRVIFFFKKYLCSVSNLRVPIWEKHQLDHH